MTAKPHMAASINMGMIFLGRSPLGGQITVHPVVLRVTSCVSVMSIIGYFWRWLPRDALAFWKKADAKARLRPL
jgi:hypothetical protein